MNARQKHPAGIALVVVLFLLMMLIVVVLAFFTTTTIESNTSVAYADAVTVRQLADSALHLAQGQLRDATLGQTTDEKAETLAWTSQPGMIRTFSANGEARRFFKLYSADAMVVPAADFKPDLATLPGIAGGAADEWRTGANADIYTDLNTPEKDSTGRLVYPILDPRGEKGFASLGDTVETPKMEIEGFAIGNRLGYDDKTASGPDNNPAPMPVKWLYLLRDGTMTTAQSDGKKGVTITGATAANPIVGRVAFWMDDETAKVNINTASEGTYWDVPRIYSKQDFGEYLTNTHGMAMCQPVQKEYQRYPGHPATTCLSSIFGSLLPVTSPYPTNPQNTDAAALDAYYKITPRVGLPVAMGGGGGGSLGGSYQVSASSVDPMKTDTERLYASVDELMFKPVLIGTDKGFFRVPNTSTTATPGSITRSVLEKSKFFVTANSSAPETTLYNTPRIAVWPVADTDARRTTFDKLLAFCSTVGDVRKPIGTGNYPYYFTRIPGSGAIPGIGARNATLDYSTRNQQLYAYLRNLTSMSVPGFGGKFVEKFSQDGVDVGEREQILTYIYDYIRCTNLQDQSGNATYTPLFSSGQLGAGEVVPIRISSGKFTTQGFGRFYSVTSANLLFYGTRMAGTKVDRMRAVFFLGFTTPQQGLACMRSNMKYVVRGLDGLLAEGKTLNFKPGGTNYMDVSDLSLFHGRSVGGTESPWQAIKGKPFVDADAGGNAHNKYPFFSYLDVDVTTFPNYSSTTLKTEFNFSASNEITVEIRTADTDQQVQVLHFKFPTGRFVVPTNVVGTGGFGGRTGGDYNQLINGSDTVVALQVGGADTSANANKPEPALDSTCGDIRMTASLIDVPANRFRADMNYQQPKDKPAIQFAHCLVQSVGEPFVGAKYGKLANVTAYKQTGSIARQPDVPSRAPIGVTRAAASGGGPGDWDTGFGDQKDGAYINKPDEGDTALTDITNGRTRLPYMLGYGKGFASATNTYFSPNRQIPSPLMLGSIPTGVQRMLPWQTLLFHPRPEDPTHPGKSISPKDHLLADLFWMPVVEPYAISQPFATNGKINLNYQIMPFTNITRTTGLRAVMKSTRFAALALSDSQIYKPLDATGAGVPPTAPDRRLPIEMNDINATLKGFDAKFASPDNNTNIFKSASQICEMNLVPRGETDATMAAFWRTKFAFTGDNLREKPYADLYPRLTTKSNTYTVHVRVEALQKAKGTPPDQWIPNRDRIAGEYRGSSIIERYIDVNDPTLPDFARISANDPAAPELNIDRYYRIRVVSTRRFNP